MPGGIAPIAAVGAPQVPIPSPVDSALEAVGDYPKQKQDYDYKQAEIDAQGIDNSSKKLSVLTKILSANPAMYSNPQMVSAAQRAFSGLGLTAPMKNVNGVNQLDPEALASFGPASDFMAANLSTILSFPPAQRSALIQSFTGQQLSPELESKLTSLPQRMISTPSELANLYGKATSLIESLRYPGTDVNSVIAALHPMNQVLESNGMPGIEEGDIEQSAYTNLLQQATLNGMDAKAAQQYANAGLEKIKTQLYPQVVANQTTTAGARAESADASMIRSKSYANRELPEIQKDQATTKHLQAETADLLGTSGTGSTKSNEQHLQRLVTVANQAQALYERFSQDYAVANATAQSPTATPEDRAGAQKQAAELRQEMSDSHETAMRAQKAYETAQRGSSSGSGTSHVPPGAPTKTAPDGTLIYKGPDGKAHRADNGQLYTPP